MQRPKRILLTGGGTAGHVNPALAIGAALRSEDTRFLYVGVKGRAESVVVPRESIPIRFVRASAYPGLKPSGALVAFFLNLVVGMLQSIVILLTYRPHRIVATGGFVSAPVLFAAFLLRRLRVLRTRVFLHEQNAVPGKLNQLVGRLADRVFLTFPESRAYFPRNGVVTGYPLRRRIGSVSREEALAGLDFPLPKGRTVVFAFGGSQGARTINRAVVDALRDLLPYQDRVFVVHGLGLLSSSDYHAQDDTRARLAERYTEEERRRIETFYVSRPFFHDIEKLYALADVVVVRAGAGSLNELSAVGLPAIVVPKANLPGDHQVMNARAMQRVSGAVVLYEETVLEDGRLIEKLDGGLLGRALVSLLGDPARLAEMRRRSKGALGQDAAAEIARLIEEKGGGPVAVPSLPDLAPLPSNQELLAALEKVAAAKGDAYSPEAVELALLGEGRASDVPYLKSRATSLLVSPEWEQRNLGVKLLGLLHAKERLPLLLALLADRRKAPLLERLLGGDYVQVGFIRRNAMVALSRIGEVTPEVEDALLLGLRDPYYETRVEAANAVARFGARLSRRGELAARLIELLGDGRFEVACAAAEALGRAGDAEDALPALLALHDAKPWKVRSAALSGVLSLVERGQVRDLSRLSEALQTFALTSTDFTPQFELKLRYRRLREAVSGREAQA